MQMGFFFLPLAIILVFKPCGAKPCWMGVHGFQMLLGVNMAALTTAIVMCSMKLNANAVICVGSTVLISIYQVLISATQYTRCTFFDVEREYNAVTRTNIEVLPGW